MIHFVNYWTVSHGDLPKISLVRGYPQPELELVMAHSGTYSHAQAAPYATQLHS